MRNGLDLIGVNWVSHYRQRKPVIKEGIFDDGSMVPRVAEFKVGGIDLGAAVIKMDALRTYDLRFLETADVASGKRRLAEVVHLADGLLLERLASQTQKKVLIQPILYVHQ